MTRAFCQQYRCMAGVTFMSLLLQEERRKLHSPLTEAIWMRQVRGACMGFLSADPAIAEAALLLRSRAFAVPRSAISMGELLVMAVSKADLKLIPPVTRKQQKLQQDRLDIFFKLPFARVQVQLSDEAGRTARHHHCSKQDRLVPCLPLCLTLAADWNSVC